PPGRAPTPPAPNTAPSPPEPRSPPARTTCSATARSCPTTAHQRPSPTARHQLVALVEGPVLEDHDPLRRPRRRLPSRDHLRLGVDRVAVEDRCWERN